jgi:hypothetical protein
MPAFDDDRWELYDTTRDWSQAHDLSAEHPDKLHELQRLWLIEAVKYGVLPLDDRSAERVNPDLAGRPTLIKGNSQLLFGGMGRLSENSVVNIKNKSHAITAEVVVPESGADGVIVAQGGSIGGWSLYAKGGTVLLFLDGEKVGEGRVAATAAMIFSADDTCDVGMEGGAGKVREPPPEQTALGREAGRFQEATGEEAS